MKVVFRHRQIGPVVGLVTGILLSAGAGLPAEDTVERNDLPSGFLNPPDEARPGSYWLVLNGHLDREHARKELRQLREAGISGLCVFDMGARGPEGTTPPAGPAFLSAKSVSDLAFVIREAAGLGMEVQLSVSSSWDMGGSWVEPAHASMGLFHAEMEVRGPASLDLDLPMPPIPSRAPRRADGAPSFRRDVAVLAVPSPRRLPGHDFIFRLDPPGVHRIDRVVLFNAESGDAGRYGPEHLFTREFSVAVSLEPHGSGGYREVLRSELEPRTGPQSFDVKPVRAAFIRLRILSGHNEDEDRVQLGEFEAYSGDGLNVVASHEANRQRDGAELIHFSSALGYQRRWTASNIHDGVESGPDGTWSSAGPPPLLIERREEIVDLSDHIDSGGRLRWDAPEGEWLIQRFVCLNTGERLKVPSPESDGLATDHLSAAATEHTIQTVIDRLRGELGDLAGTALEHLYLASYEVRGPIWTPGFLARFREYRGYDMMRFLPTLSGSIVRDLATTSRFRYDYRKTLGDLLVDAYYRKASETAQLAGLGIESEAGGPGPPIHSVPVSALEALGVIDSVRGEFWPKRPDADNLWVVKETASAAHIYGKRRVHMEAFTSMHHWQDGPQDLKPAADRAFCEGMNHVVWHTSSHSPPAAGKPGWVYGAGTHLNPNLIWWPMAGAFLDYLARCSFLLQRGRFVADVCYYYGDQGYNFVKPKHRGFSPGPGRDYDVTDAVVLRSRMSVENGRIVLPDGMTYELLVLPDREDCDPGVLEALERLVEEGATVLGPRPRRASGLDVSGERDRRVREIAGRLWGPAGDRATGERATGKGRIIWGSTSEEVLSERGMGPDFSYPGRSIDGELDFIHRRTDDTDIYFVSNRTDRPVRTEATFRVRGRAPELWDPRNGHRRRPAVYRATPGGTELPMSLAPRGSIFVVFREEISSLHVTTSGWKADLRSGCDLEPSIELVDGDGVRVTAFGSGQMHLETAAGENLELRVETLPETVDLSDGWDVSFESEADEPDPIMLQQLAPLNEHPDERVRHFSGLARYRRSFHVLAAWLAPGFRIRLDLGDLWAVGRVRINGKDLGVVWSRPFQLDVTDSLRHGNNILVVEIANTWSNRLVGDARAALGAGKTGTNVTRTAGVAWKDAPLLRSGLLGPVRVVFGRELTVGLR